MSLFSNTQIKNPLLPKPSKNSSKKMKIEMGAIDSIQGDFFFKSIGNS